MWEQHQNTFHAHVRPTTTGGTCIIVVQTCIVYVYIHNSMYVGVYIHNLCDRKPSDSHNSHFEAQLFVAIGHPQYHHGDDVEPLAVAYIGIVPSVS